jgi:hypothetical protein
MELPVKWNHFAMKKYAVPYDTPTAMPSAVRAAPIFQMLESGYL